MMKYPYLETTKKAVAEQMASLTDGLTGWDLRDAISGSAKKAADSIVNGMTDEDIAKNFAKLAQEYEKHRINYAEDWYENGVDYPSPFDGISYGENDSIKYCIERKEHLEKDRRGRILNILDFSTILRYDLTSGSPIEVCKGFGRANYKWSEDATDLTEAMKTALWKNAYRLAKNTRLMPK